MITWFPMETGRALHAPTHKHDHAGLGELLRRARERRGLTLEQISNETKIPQRHLEALERDNLAAVPGGFYRRAEIRTYARAVNLDQNLALAELERALEPPGVPREVLPQTPGTEAPMLSRTRLLIAIGVVVAAAVLGRGTGGREPALASQPTQGEEVPTPSAPSEGARAVATEPTGAGESAASSGDVARTPTQAGARASADSVTELVVTTDPPGARVTVDGIGWGAAPVTIRYLPAGDKRIRVSKEGYVTEERVMALAEGHLRPVDIRLRSAP
jgi:cytoskeletal protein RodZ